MCWYNCTHGVDSDTWESARERLSNLASNLAAAAFGCLAFYYGSILDGSQAHWRPGCGKPAPSFDGEEGSWP